LAALLGQFAQLVAFEARLRLPKSGAEVEQGRHVVPAVAH
jgi:hypothetical protein